MARITKPADRTRDAKTLDIRSESMLYEGANLTQLCRIFEMDLKELKAKMITLPPCGTRNNYSIWKIGEVARLVVNPIDDIETRLKNMNARELPKNLSKDFWAGMKSRQEYLIKAGELWNTKEVVEALGEAFKHVRMSLLLLADNVERETEFSEKARVKLQKMIDETLNQAADSLVKRFEEDAKKVRDLDDEL